MANTKELSRHIPDYPMALECFSPRTITLLSVPGNKAESKESVSLCIPMGTSFLACFQEDNLRKFVAFNSATAKPYTHSQASTRIVCVWWIVTTSSSQ